MMTDGQAITFILLGILFGLTVGSLCGFGHGFSEGFASSDKRHKVRAADINNPDPIGIKPHLQKLREMTNGRFQRTGMEKMDTFVGCLVKRKFPQYLDYTDSELGQVFDTSGCMPEFISKEVERWQSKLTGQDMDDELQRLRAERERAEKGASGKV